jgi:hypothetical protein
MIDIKKEDIPAAVILGIAELERIRSEEPHKIGLYDALTLPLDTVRQLVKKIEKLLSEEDWCLAEAALASFDKSLEHMEQITKALESQVGHIEVLSTQHPMYIWGQIKGVVVAPTSSTARQEVSHE